MRGKGFSSGGRGAWLLLVLRLAADVSNLHRISGPKAQHDYLHYSYHY